MQSFQQCSAPLKACKPLKSCSTRSASTKLGASRTYTADKVQSPKGIDLEERYLAEEVQIESIFGRDQHLYLPPSAASTSGNSSTIRASSAQKLGRAGSRNRGNLDGSYIAQVKMLETIYKKSRRDGVADLAQPPTDKQQSSFVQSNFVQGQTFTAAATSQNKKLLGTNLVRPTTHPAVAAAALAEAPQQALPAGMEPAGRMVQKLSLHGQTVTDASAMKSMHRAKLTLHAHSPSNPALIMPTASTLSSPAAHLDAAMHLAARAAPALLAPRPGSPEAALQQAPVQGYMPGVMAALQVCRAVYRRAGSALQLRNQRAMLRLQRLPRKAAGKTGLHRLNKRSLQLLQAAPQAATAAPVVYHPPSDITVQMVLNAVISGKQEQLAMIVEKAPVYILNMALPALGKVQKLKELEQLLTCMTEKGRMETHSFAMAFCALREADRLDKALQLFNQACKNNVDIGPAGASALIKLIAQQRDLDLAMDVFQQLLHAGITLNRYTFNCVIHLCGVLGRLDDGLKVLRVMRKMGNADSLPDTYTYQALVRAIDTSEKFPRLMSIFKEMQKDQVQPYPELWCMYIIVAGRGQRPDWAEHFFNAALDSGHVPTQQMYNALLASLARVSELDKLLDIYRRMLVDGLCPDEYTFNALLTGMSRVGASLYVVEDLVAEMHKWGVQLNTYLGTSLINAYRRVPELLDVYGPIGSLLLERVDDVLAKLAQQRLANSQTYACVMAMHAQVGNLPKVSKLMKEMSQAGIRPDAHTFFALSKGFEEGGFAQQALHFKEQAELLNSQRAKAGSWARAPEGAQAGPGHVHYKQGHGRRDAKYDVGVQYAGKKNNKKVPVKI